MDAQSTFKRIHKIMKLFVVINAERRLTAPPMCRVDKILSVIAAGRPFSSGHLYKHSFRRRTRIYGKAQSIQLTNSLHTFLQFSLLDDKIRGNISNDYKRADLKRRAGCTVCLS